VAAAIDIEQTWTAEAWNTAQHHVLEPIFYFVYNNRWLRIIACKQVYRSRNVCIHPPLCPDVCKSPPLRYGISAFSYVFSADEHYATVLQAQGTKIRLFIVWMSGTVLCTVSPHPSTFQLCSRRTLRSSRLANCHR
jgi:hypothetical protein